MYRSPDIKNLGIHLDVPRGLVVGEARGPAAGAGIRSGDRIVAIGDRSVLTFGDLQFYYDKTPRDGERIQLTGARQSEQGDQEALVPLQLDLPHQWWRTDLGYRYWTVEPLVYYESRPLSEEEKAEHGLPIGGFASRVTSDGARGSRVAVHDLQVGDITFSVDGVETDDIADSTDLFIKLRKTAGDTVKLGVIRDGKKLEVPLRTRRQSFRK
jgi:S1-C subfamily serine protease